MRAKRQQAGPLNWGDAGLARAIRHPLGAGLARRLRLQFPAAIYYVINCGNYRRDLFETVGAAKSFKGTPGETNTRFGWVNHAFGILRNHFHLALTAGSPNRWPWVHRTRCGSRCVDSLTCNRQTPSISPAQRSEEQRTAVLSRGGLKGARVEDLLPKSTSASALGGRSVLARDESNPNRIISPASRLLHRSSPSFRFGQHALNRCHRWWI